jgi:hypothetical protein
VARREGVAGVDAHADPIRVAEGADDVAQVLEPVADRAGPAPPG